MFCMSQDSLPAANDKAKKRTRQKKAPKKITETYLHNAGLYYLQRFSSSSGNFREVMLRKIKKSCMAHPDQNLEDCTALLDKLIDTFINAGLLDDLTYTRSMVNSLRRRGKSTHAIHSHLRSKKLGHDIIEKSLNERDNEQHENSAEAEYQAAVTFARKKRIGPFGAAQNTDDETARKQLARLARAGFSYDTARRVLNINNDELEDC